jgi:L,D-transpeptidase catalytic domain
MFRVERAMGRTTMRIFMSGLSLFRSAIALALLALFASCAEIETPPTTTAPVAPTPPPGYWNGDGISGAPKIVVSISEQRAYYYKGKRLVGEATVSTGKPGFSTPPGNYSVVWKDKDHISTRFGDYVDDFGAVVKSNVDSAKDRRPPGSRFDGARMPYAMFFRGGYAMHQGYVPPYAASHGCIRLPQGMADIFFDNSPLGTPVVVKEAPVESVSVSREQFDRSPPAVPVSTTVPPPAPNLVRSTAPASVRPASVRSTVPAPTPVLSRAPAPVPVPVRSPSPVPVRSLAPASVRPASVRSTVPAPTPVLSRAPAPVPVPVRSPSPVPVRSLAPASVRPASVRSTVPAPTPVLSRAPAPVPVPVRSPSPVPVRSLAPASVRPTPTPVLSRKHRRVRSRAPVRPPQTSPTPTPTR